MPRKSPTSLRINPNVRCLRVYPVEATHKNVQELKPVGIKLSREQALALAGVLLAAAQDWHEIEITAYRYDKRKSDGTYHITVTSFEKEKG